MKINISAQGKYDIVREYLEPNGVTQAALARRHAVAQSTIAAWVSDFKDLVLREHARAINKGTQEAIARINLDIKNLVAKVSFLEGKLAYSKNEKTLITM